MTITDPGHGTGPSEGGSASRTRRRPTFAGARPWTTGTPGTLDFTARVGAACAVLCALLFLGCMTYTLAGHRHWAGLAAFVVSLVFAALALLTAAPYVIRRDQPAAGLLPRVTMWGTGIVLAVLQLTAGVLGDAEFSMVTVIGITAVLAVPCFGELAGQAASPARGTATGHASARGHRAPSAAATAPAADADAATVSTPVSKPGSSSGAPSPSPTSATGGGSAHPPVEEHREPAAPAAGAVPPPPQERPVADRLRKSDRLSKTDSPTRTDSLSKTDPLSKTDRLRKD